MTAPETLEGWFALHDFRRLDWSAWGRLDATEREKALVEATDLLGAFQQVEDAPAGRSVGYTVIGHKADLLLFHLRPDLGQLQTLERAFDQTMLAMCTTRPYSYLSVIEISRHGAPEGAAENVEDSPYMQSRLYPEIPDHSRYLCFYPMNKKREGADNWYSLEAPERGELMRAHGRTGRRYAGKVSQIVTGSIGLDDWEWGVTLFADDPIQFKKLIYEMRFDEVSARFAEFGPFYVGRRLRAEDLRRWLGE
jgi:chlorite dismutase